MIVRGFRKCCIPDAVDGMDDEEEVGNVGSEHENVSIKCEAEDGNCEDVNWDRW
jgi:hypothetical protein